jgi:hypothetical protein
MIAAAFDRQGWHWWPMPAGIISEPYDGRPASNGCTINDIAMRTGPTARRPGICWGRAGWALTRRRRLSTAGIRVGGSESLCDRWQQLRHRGVVNPTSTVSALALRAARHIADNFTDLRRATKPG